MRPTTPQTLMATSAVRRLADLATSLYKICNFPERWASAAAGSAAGKLFAARRSPIRRDCIRLSTPELCGGVFCCDCGKLAGMLNLPRSSVRTAFAITGWIAVRLATFQLQSSLGSDLRAFMQFLILLASIACAINYRDERRTFGIGFAFVLILYSVSVLRDALGDSILRFNWLVNIRRNLLTIL